MSGKRYKGAVDYEDYIDAGLHIFPLHPIDFTSNTCSCENPDCEAAGKHPLMSNWQYTATWDEVQLAHWTGEDGIRDENAFLRGFGVNLTYSPVLVVDVDFRNGGVESLERLGADIGINLMDECGFAVNTGSGMGSVHLYWLVPEQWQSTPLNYQLREYEGIEFKTSGFVVGCGSEHISGETYSNKHGRPQDMVDAPDALLELLKRPERLKSTFDGKTVEYSEGELKSVVTAITSGKADYDKWVRVGMAIHHATGGSAEGEALWDEWSKGADNYEPGQISTKWHSFGKSPQDHLTIASLHMWAKEDGYSEPVVFQSTDESLYADMPSSTTPIIAKSELASINEHSVNLRRPPGLVGQIAAWMNSRSMYPRGALAVGAALMAVSNAAGLRYRVDGFNTSLNLIVLGIAGSGSGKGSILNDLQAIHRMVGLSPASHGAIKSEQELIRNQIRHQAAFYLIDEVGSFLNKVANSMRTGRTAYLEHVIGTLMSLYSAANASFDVSGDLKEEMAERVQKDIARTQKRLDSGVDDKTAQALEDDLDKLRRSLDETQSGIENPLMSLYGVSEPHRFDEAVNGDEWLITGGFIGRSLIFNETNGVPRRRDMDGYSSHEMPSDIKSSLTMLYMGGHREKPKRVERLGEITTIKMTPEAREAEQAIYEYWHERGVAEHDEGTGMHTLTIRATELTLKVAGVLGVGSGLITLEHMQWAFALVRQSTDEKMARAKATRGAESTDAKERGGGAIEAVKSLLLGGDEYTVGVIVNRFRRVYDREQIQKTLDWLVSQGAINAVDRTARNGRTFTYYSIV